MTFTHDERDTSRAISLGKSSTRTLRYWVASDEFADDEDALAYIVDQFPETYQGLVRQGIDLDPVNAGRLWYANATYGTRERREPGSVSWNFNIGTAQQHIEHSLGTVSSYAASGEVAPDFKGAINVRAASAEVVCEGLDIHVPTLEWEETHSHDFATFNLQSYVAMLYAATGRVNSTQWRCFAPREVLFLGATGQPAGQYTVDMTYRFSASPTATNLTIGNITGITKAGWDYLWVFACDSEDPATLVRTKKPISVHVERIFYECDFSVLGLNDLFKVQ